MILATDSDARSIGRATESVLEFYEQVIRCHSLPLRPSPVHGVGEALKTYRVRPASNPLSETVALWRSSSAPKCDGPSYRTHS
jgi:hypothetical protein